MTYYDCTIVLNPQLEETGLDSFVKDTRDLISSHGGNVVLEKRMGMRRLAYEIQKLTQGYYFSLVFEGEGKTVNELERQLRLDENCVRFLTCLALKKVVKQVTSTETASETPAPAKEAPAPDAIKPETEEPAPEPKAEENQEPKEEI